MSKVIVTGGGGFIGSHLVDKLISKGVKVYVIDKSPKYKNPKAKYYPFDIRENLNGLEYFVNNIDVIFHLAAETSVQESIENPQLYHDTNVSGTLNMLNLALKIKAKKFIFSSSSAVYGEPQYVPIDEKHPLNPLSPYALSKAIGEQYCNLYSKIYNLDTICLRYFNAYGNRMNDVGAYRSVISVFKEQYNKNQPLNIVNDGEQKRDFVHVDDIVEANILSSLSNKKGKTYNVGTGNSYTVNKIADMFGGKKIYGEKRIEPKNSISNKNKISLDLDWQPKGDLEKWIETLKN
tara:strand:- start:42 stop:917 length:876 start_codon:yes stop_codon:yes gene_type:complete